MFLLHRRKTGLRSVKCLHTSVKLEVKTEARVFIQDFLALKPLFPLEYILLPGHIGQE